MRSPLIIDDLTTDIHPRMWMDPPLRHMDEFKQAVDTALRILVPKAVRKIAEKYFKTLTEEQRFKGEAVRNTLLTTAPIYIQFEGKAESHSILITKSKTWAIYKINKPGAKAMIECAVFLEPNREFESATDNSPADPEAEKNLCTMLLTAFEIFDLIANRQATFMPGPDTYRIKAGEKVPYRPFNVLVPDPNQTIVNKLAEQFAKQKESPVPAPPIYRIENGFAVTRCYVTKEEGRVHLGTNLSKEMITPIEVTKAFHAAGWDFDPFNASRIRSPKYARITPPPKPVLTLVPRTPMTKPIETLTPVPARVLTPKERTAVRDMLDIHFDELLGRYAGDWSDQKIGDALNLPFALVAGLRDAAYGPIKSDPEIEALEARLTAAEDLLVTAEQQLSTALDTLEHAKREHEGIRGRLSTMAQRRKAG